MSAESRQTSTVDRSSWRDAPISPGGKTSLVYILGAGFSGSTLLTMLLGSHPEICTVGELKMVQLGDVASYRCSCGATITTCPFWGRVRAEMMLRGHPLDFASPQMDIRSVQSRYAQFLLRPLHRGPLMERLRDAALALSPTWRRALAEIQMRNEVLVKCISAGTGKKVVVDSSKTGIRLKYLLRTPALEVRVVWLIRDGRATSLSLMSRTRFGESAGRSPRRETIGQNGEHIRQRMAAAAWQWRRSNEEAEQIVRRLDRRIWTQVRYEELCEKPKDTLRSLLAFIGVDQNVQVGDFRAGEHHVIGNAMRLKSTSEIRLDERWRTALSEDDLAKFERIAGRLNRTLGYQVDTKSTRAHAETWDVTL